MVRCKAGRQSSETRIFTSMAELDIGSVRLVKATRALRDVFDMYVLDLLPGVKYVCAVPMA